MFVNRDKEIAKINNALQKSESQLIVIYGRRRCGKSTLLRHVLPKDAIYFSADLRESSLQRKALANQIEGAIGGFSKPQYADWESLLINLNNSLTNRTTLCLDEFPYLVKNSPELPSVIQKFVDQKHQNKLHLILCGSSQQMMHSLVLDSSAPLYGRSNEIIRVKPMNVKNMKDYMSVSATEAIAEYGVWGGVPRYWEIRVGATGFDEAIKQNLLDQNGILYEEPERLFLDEMRTSVQAYSILSLIGSGVHRLSEIAGRLGKPATHLGRMLTFLINQGYIKREIPFGESARSSKKSLYKLADPFLNFYFTYLIPNKSRLEFDLIDEVWNDLKGNFNIYLSAIWEEICRNAIPYLEIDGKRFNPGQRWWGNGLDKKPMEIDVVAESVDKTTLLVGEVKWSESVSIAEIESALDNKVSRIPFAKNRKVIKAVFVKNKTQSSTSDVKIFTPDEIVNAMP